MPSWITGLDHQLHVPFCHQARNSCHWPDHDYHHHLKTKVVAPQRTRMYSCIIAVLYCAAFEKLYLSRPWFRLDETFALHPFPCSSPPPSWLVKSTLGRSKCHPPTDVSPPREMSPPLTLSPPTYHQPGKCYPPSDVVTSCHSIARSALF